MARHYGLFKSYPSTFGWHDLEKARERLTVWDDVRNYQARNTLRDDGVLFYHAQGPRALEDDTLAAGDSSVDPAGGGGGVEDRSEAGPGLTIREGRPADSPFVVGLGATAFARFGDYGPIMQGFLASPDVSSLIAEAAGDPVGFALVDVAPAHPGFADLVAIAVDSRHRRTGVGRALLKRVIASREERGESSLLVLTVADDNAAAITLFRSLGFEMIPGALGRYAGGQTSRRMAKLVLPGEAR